MGVFHMPLKVESPLRPQQQEESPEPISYCRTVLVNAFDQPIGLVTPLRE